MKVNFYSTWFALDFRCFSTARVLIVNSNSRTAAKALRWHPYVHRKSIVGSNFEVLKRRSCNYQREKKYTSVVAYRYQILTKRKLT